MGDQSRSEELITARRTMHQGQNGHSVQGDNNTFAQVTRRLATAASLAIVLAAVPATAQVNTHICRAVGASGYVLDGNTKVLTKAGGANEIPYEVKHRTNLRRLEGNCASGVGLFPFKQEVVGITVAFDEGTDRIERRFVCQTMQYTKPMGRKCDREIRRIDWTAPDRYQSEYR
jgi:hypothetical protein